MHARIAAAYARAGVEIDIAGSSAFGRTYALLQGPEGVDPSELERLLPEAHWYGEAIIALAIEPAPADALPMLAQALGGPGAPAGVVACERAGESIIVEFRPALTQPALLLRIADVELQRFRGYRRTQLLSPLPVAVTAAIAAGGLQAPEVEPARILETLLERAHVE
jgi:hypothetical protein